MNLSEFFRQTMPEWEHSSRWYDVERVSSRADALAEMAFDSRLFDGLDEALVRRAAANYVAAQGS